MLPNLLLRDMARANPTTNPPRSTMTDPNLLRKDRQDEARRQQQADERVHELEQALKYILRRCDEAVYDGDGKPRYFEPIRAEAQDALDGGGGDE